MVQWSDDFSTGIPSLDQQHQTLFRMVGDYRAALDEGRGEQVYALFLESLSRFARAHFGLEEDCMVKYACPAAKINAEAHAHFSGVLEDSIERFGRSGFDRRAATALVEMLEDWLLRHIAHIDTRLRESVESSAADGA
ncbi:MAG: bacteriohemerythrin [Hyphomicrobiales bacterium]